MSRVSKYRLDRDMESEVFRLFWESLGSLRGAEEVSSFFSDFLTETEEIMLAKRFAVALLLLRGKRPVDIVPTLHVTYTTVGSVGAWVKNAKPGTRRSLENMMRQQNWQKLLDRIDALLDSLPLRHGVNWTQMGTERRQRRIERSVRDAVR